MAAVSQSLYWRLSIAYVAGITHWDISNVSCCVPPVTRKSQSPRSSILCVLLFFSSGRYHFLFIFCSFFSFLNKKSRGRMTTSLGRGGLLFVSSVSIAARSTASTQQTVAFAVALPSSSSSSFLFDWIACACVCDASIEYDAYDST